ncbi:hypothetical protein CRYUN_Cryun19dG0060600 [Craigia yunnanensis]
MQNSVPAITFLMASALRLEQINIAIRDGLAKVFGNYCKCRRCHYNYSLQRSPSVTPIKYNTRIFQGREVLKETVELDLGMYLLPWALLIMAWLVGFSGVLKKYPAKLALHFHASSD